jgi:hypothetical protein
MDHLRMQSENQFLRFLPAERRQEIHASWYVDATHTLDYSRIDRPQGTDHATQIVYTSPDVKTELIGMILARNPAVSGPPDLLNRCGAPPCDRGGASALERRAERALRPLAGVRGAWVAPLPDLTFLRVHDSKPGGEAAAYSLVHDRAHANVAFLFGEDQRLVPQDDTVAVVPGYTGSYPNFVFDVDVADVERFTRALIRVKNASDLETLVEHWGVRRTSPNFWSTIDWLHADYRRLEPTEFGLFDLNRYKNL